MLFEILNQVQDDERGKGSRPGYGTSWGYSKIIQIKEYSEQPVVKILLKTYIMKQLIPFLAIGIISFSLSAQNNDIKKLNLTEFSIIFGENSGSFDAGSFDEMKKLAPGSVILEDDLSGYYFYGYSENYNSSVFSALVGFQFANNDKTDLKNNPLLRIGVSYYSLFGDSRRATKEERYPYDTLTSSQTGEMYFYDSVYTKTYYINYTQEKLQLDVSMLFRTQSESRWMLYAGLGLSAGIGINARTDVVFSESSSIESHPGNSSTYVNSETTREQFSNKTSINYSAYLPLGLDFGLSKKHDFWKQIHLFLETRPGFEVTSIPELGARSGVIFQSALGIRVAWN